MVPKRDGAHPVLDAFPFESNPESPWSRERIAGYVAVKLEDDRCGGGADAEVHADV